MLHPNLNFGNIRQNNLLDLLKQRRSEIREAVKTVISSFTAEQTTAKLIQIMNDFSSGNANLEATLSELEKLWITPQVSVEGTKAVISFEYNGKNYTIQYIAPEPTTEPTPEPEVTSDNAENPPTNPVVDEPEEPVSDESNQTQVVESPLTEKTPDENTPEELALAELIENYEDKENIESFDEITKLLDAIGIEFSIVSEGDNTKSITFEFNNVTYTFYNTVETTLPEPKEPVVDEPIVEEPVADEPDEPDAAGGRRVGPNRLVDGDTLGVNSNSEITTPGTNKKEQALKQAITEFLEELDEIETTGYNFARHLDSVQLSSLKEYLEKLNDKETYPNLELKIEFKEDNLCDIYLKENGEYVYSVDDLDAEQVRGIITSKEAPIETSKTDADIIANLLKETIPDIDSAKVQAMIDDLTSMAESKGVDPTEYVDARLIDFLVMRAENPNLTLDEMNETLALNDVLDLSLNSLVPTVSELFSTDITSFEDLLEFQNWEKLLIDEYPQAREAYIQTSRMTYLTLAQDGELTKGDYYELIKLDLANIFPDFDELDDADRAEVTNKINSLSPEQVEYFINKAIELPGCYQDGYDEALNNFFDEFDGSVSGSAYSLSNSDELITLSEVYTSISGIEFNPDSIIEANTKLEKIEEAINESVTYQTALNIFDAVDNGSKDIGSALWQIGCLYTGSIEDEDIAQFLREITGNNDIYVENGTVVISQSAMVRGNGKQNGSTQDNSVLDSVKDYCKDTFKGVVDLCVSQSVQDTWNNSDLTTIDGFINFADNLLSDPNFYEDLGKGLLVGAGIAATGGLGTGVLITGSIGASAVASGATCEFLQRCKAEGEVTSDNITNFAATLGEAALDFYGVKTAGLAFELPSAMKGILNKVTSGVKSTINQIVDKFPNIKQNLAKNFSGVLSKSLTAEEQSAFIKKYGFISGEEKIRDGLVIEGATQVGKNYVSKATQNTIVDRTKDSFLNKMIDEIKILTQGKSDKEKADIIQDYILKICNGKGTQYTALRSESLPNNILLGEVFEKYPESAVCRHRATLFKVLADEVDLKVTLQAGQKTFFGMDGSLGYIDERFGNYANHIWNYVKINNKSYIFDPMTGDILDINKTTKTLFKDFYGDINGVQLYNRPATMRLKRIAASVTTLLAAAGAVAQNQTPEVPPTQPNNPQPTEQPEKPQDNNSYDKDGYDRNGYDREGYDRQGYDRNGYDRYGYDRQGYDRDGYDREGYDREGYNRNGYDRYGERKDDNSQSGSPSGSGTWGDSSQANGAQSNPGTQNDNAVSPQDNGNGQGDSTGDGQGTPTTGEGEQGAGSGQGVGAGQDDNAQGQGETQTQTITVTAQELHAFGILPSTITTNNSGDGNKVGSSDIDPKAVEEELNKQARENNTGYTYTITSNGDGTYNLTRTRTTTVPFASDSNNGAGFIDWNSMPTPATLFDLENEINKRLNDPNYLLASTSGGGDDGGLGKLLELRYNLESGAYSNNYTKYYQDLYDAGLISELGFFGIPELDNFFNTNEFVNEDGSFNIDRYNELCQQYGINPDDYDIS